MSKQRIIIDTSLTAAGFKSVCDLAPGELEAAINLSEFITACTGGNQMAKFDVLVGSVQGSGTIVSTGAATAAQTMTLANVTLTAHGSVAANNQFVVSATPATQAANIAACINSSTSLAGIVTAVALSGTVTVTSIVPGKIGNSIQISAGTLSNVTVGQFSGSVEGTSYTIDLR